jgi:hypothetical protein
MRRFRDDLRAAVSALTATPDQALFAAYASAEPGQFDVENVLLYNVGPAAFTRSAGHELVVELRPGEVPEPPRPMPAAHYHSYEVVDAGTPWTRWYTEHLLAEFASEEVESIGASSVWFAVRRGMVSIHGRPAGRGPIALELTLETSRQSLNLPALAKPLIDGVIAAFHVHDHRSSSEEVAERVGRQLGIPSTDVAQLLTVSDLALLGTRQLLWAWRDGVQWNPDDGRVVAFRLRRHEAKMGSAGAVRVVGRMLEIARR